MCLEYIFNFRKKSHFTIFYLCGNLCGPDVNMPQSRKCHWYNSSGLGQVISMASYRYGGLWGVNCVSGGFEKYRNYHNAG